MKKGEEYIGTVIQVLFPNHGIVDCNGEKVKIKGGITGETVRVRVNKIRGGHYEGTLTEVLKKADTETEAACIHAKECGGCCYQTLPYEEQRKLKEKQLRELLGRVTNPEILSEVLPSPSPEAYRNKMEFSFGDAQKGGELTLGLHKKGSFYDIVTTDACKIAHSDFGIILREVLKFAREKELPFYHKMTHTGYLRHLLIRRAQKTGDILVNLVTTTQIEADVTQLAERLLALPLEGHFAGILHGKNDSYADMVRCDSVEVLYGKEYFYEELLGLRFKISTFSFFQTNSLGAEVLYRTVCEMIAQTDQAVQNDMMTGNTLLHGTVFDLYSGTGTIAQLLARSAKRVVGVEIVEEAVAAAKENMRLNGLNNCTFIAGDVFKVLDEVDEKPDVIVLDPPREGVLPKTLQKILNYGVQNLVYISCKPTSLIRDLEIFMNAGYQPVKAVGVDMFPMTANVETVVLLSKTNMGID